MKNLLKILEFILTIHRIPASIISVSSITVTEVSVVSATRIIIGVMMFVLGFVVYFGKKGLKMIVGRWNGFKIY